MVLVVGAVMFALVFVIAVEQRLLVLVPLLSGPLLLLHFAIAVAAVLNRLFANILE